MGYILTIQATRRGVLFPTTNVGIDSLLGSEFFPFVTPLLNQFKPQLSEIRYQAVI